MEMIIQQAQQQIMVMEHTPLAQTVQALLSIELVMLECPYYQILLE